jgi:DNA-directed RNA polymerase subunit RPC12/RpoP
VNPRISPDAFDSFFAWAPWIIGIVIYAAFYIAKRQERTPLPAAVTHAGPVTPSYSCAQCGRVGTTEQMVPQARGGAVTYVCANCAQGSSGFRPA